MKNPLRIIWTTFKRAAFVVGFFSFLLIAWSIAWPHVHALYFGVHPDFFQNLNNHLSNAEISDRISALAFDSRRDTLLIGHESGKIDIWNARRANARREVKAHKMRTSKLTFSSDGKTFFSNSSFDDFTQVWDTASGMLLHTVERASGPVIETSNRRFFIIAGSSSLHIFDLENKALLPEKYPVNSGVVTAIGYDLPTDHLAIGTASGGIEVWQFTKQLDSRNTGLLGSSGPSLTKLATAKPYETGNWVNGVGFLDKGSSLFSVAQRGAIDEWATDSLKHLRSREHLMKSSSTPIYISDKNLLAIAGIANETNYASFLELFDLESGKSSMADLKNAGGGILTYLPSVATLIGSQGNSISVIEIKSAR